MAENDGIDPEEKLHWQDRYNKMANYTYWKIRSEVESQRDMTEARSALHEGKDKFFSGEDQEARALFQERARLDSTASSRSIPISFLKKNWLKTF